MMGDNFNAPPQRVPWDKIATTVSVMMCAACFASYLDSVLEQQWDHTSSSLGAPAWSGSCSSPQAIPALNWAHLTRDPHSRTAALFSDLSDPTQDHRRYLTLLVYGMQSMGYCVTFYSVKDYHWGDAAQFVQQAESLGMPGIQRDKLQMRVWVSSAPSVRFFIYSGLGLYPRVPGIGLVNVFHYAGPSLPGHVSPSDQILSWLLAYDHVVFSSQQAYDDGMSMLSSCLQRAHAHGLLMPSTDVLLPASTVISTIGYTTELRAEGRRHIINVGKDSFESMQALGLFMRMKAQGQLPNNTQLLLMLHREHSHAENVKLFNYVQRHKLSVMVKILPHRSLHHAVGLPSLNETLVQWLFTGRRAYNHSSCVASILDGASYGFIPITTCRGPALTMIRHATDGFLANSLQEFANYTTRIFSMPPAEMLQLWNASVARAQPVQLQAFMTTLEKVEGRGVTSRSFRHLISKTLPVLRACAVANISEQAPNAAVIVEARSHYALEYVILNTMAVLAKSSQPWSLHIFSSKENEWLVSKLKTDSRFSKAHLHNLDMMNSSVSSYNSMLKSPAFWSSLGEKTEKALIFQTDSLLLGESIDEFLVYNYIGAPWHMGNEQWPEITKLVPPGVGNGGLSLRAVKVMRDITIQNASTSNEQEDLYFARNVYSRNKSGLSSREHAYRFAMEVPCYDMDLVVHSHPFSVHAAWYYTPLERTQQLLHKSIEAALRHA